jgi:hypothetical protein
MPASPRAERRDNLIDRVIVPDPDSAKPRSRLVEALAELDPAARALLDLSLRKGFPDSKLAELSGTDEPAVASFRTGVITAIAARVEMDTPEGRAQVEDELRQAPDDAWLGRTGGPDPRAEGRRPRALVLVLALVAALVAVLLITRGGSDEAGPSASATTSGSQGETGSQARSAPVALAPLAGADSGGHSTARLTDDGSLAVDVKGLPSPGDGAYRLWLFRSVIDARPIGALSSGSGTIEAQLPASAADYRYLDLTRESSPTDERYSGRVVLRLPVRDLLDGQG